MKLSHEVFMTCVMRLAFSQESLFATKKKTASDMSCAQRQMARLEMSDKFHYSYFSQRVFVMKIWFVSQKTQFFSLCRGIGAYENVHTSEHARFWLLLQYGLVPFLFSSHQHCRTVYVSHYVSTRYSDL